MSPSLLDFLRHIEHECDYLMRLCNGRDRQGLLEDETNSRAIVRSLEVIGEAVKKLPMELRAKYPQMEWSDMAGMRDVLIHHYFGISALHRVFRLRRPCASCPCPLLAVA